MSQDVLMQQVPMMMDESLVKQQNKALLVLPMVTAPAYNPKEFRCQLTLKQIQSIVSMYYPTSIEPANESLPKEETPLLLIISKYENSSTYFITNR